MTRQGWLLGLLVAPLLVGCAKEKEKKTGWQSFPVAIYADAALTSDRQAEEDLFTAMSFWESHAGRKLFDF